VNGKRRNQTFFVILKRLFCIFSFDLFESVSLLKFAYTNLKSTIFATLSGSWAALGALLAALGALLAALGRSWAALGRSWPLLAALGRPWPAFGRS
jgi:hypothetical protein